MKKTGFLIIITFCLCTSLYSQDAESIVRASRDRIETDSVYTKSKMVITAKNGSKTERVIEQYSKDGPKGDRTVIVFISPKNIAGSRFLTMNNPGSADDRWIYLPELGKIRRIAASQGSGSFMGTDFSYDDISSTSRDPALDVHTSLREENFSGKACYVIQSVPKDKSFQYSKMIQWITKDDKIICKIELYDKKNVHIKTAEMSGIKEIQGRLTTTIITMTTLKAGTSTTITSEETKYDEPISEGMFTTAFLETGNIR